MILRYPMQKQKWITKKTMTVIALAVLSCGATIYSTITDRAIPPEFLDKVQELLGFAISLVF
jgi:hypothetical protein